MRRVDFISILAAWILWVIVIISCKARRVELVDENTGLDDRPRPLRKVPPKPRQRLRMRYHFDRSAELLAAIIDGDVDGARRQSMRLGYEESIEGRRSRRPEADELRAIARRGTSITDISKASQIAAEIGVACGACHKAANALSRFPEVVVPDMSRASEKRMELHKWAALRMWEGLIGPSDERWNLGVSALVVAPLENDQMPARASAEPAIRAQARAVHELAAEGHYAIHPSARARIFARFLENCSSCHLRVGESR